MDLIQSSLKIGVDCDTKEKDEVCRIEIDSVMLYIVPIQCSMAGRHCCGGVRKVTRTWWSICWSKEPIQTLKMYVTIMVYVLVIDVLRTFYCRQLNGQA